MGSLIFQPIKSFLIRSGFNLNCLNKLDEISLDTLTVSMCLFLNTSAFLVCIDFRGGFGQFRVKGTVHRLI